MDEQPAKPRQTPPAETTPRDTYELRCSLAKNDLRELKQGVPRLAFIYGPLFALAISIAANAITHISSGEAITTGEFLGYVGACVICFIAGSLLVWYERSVHNYVNEGVDKIRRRLNDNRTD